MRITSVGAGARGAYYDRNPLEVLTLGYQINGLAPAALTQRATYTVPTGRKAFVNDLSADINRATAAGASGKISAIIHRSTASGQWRLSLFNNVVGASATKASGVNRTLLAAAVIVINTEDLSTTGTVDFDIFAYITEFDA